MIEKLESALKINASIIVNVDSSIVYLRQQNFDRGIRKFRLILDELEKLINIYDSVVLELSQYDLNYSKDNLLEILPNMLSAQQNRDYILLADLLELQLYPFILKVQEWIMAEVNYEPLMFNIDFNLECVRNTDMQLYNEIQKNTTINQSQESILECEYTTSGLFTAKCTMGKEEFYLHSNKNPHYEAMILAQSWYTEDKHKYIVYGIGLGYHISQLLECDKYIEIDVYEENLNILQLAMQYGEIGRCLTTGQVKIHYDPQYKKLAERLNRLDDNTEFVIHAPSLRLIEQQDIKARMEEYFLHYQSVKNQKGILRGNFRYNIEHYDACVDELLPEWRNKNVYIIAAGPSLDKNYHELKNVDKNDIILATGTVYSKLMAAGITPNYVIVIDGNERVIGQIRGLEKEKVPFLILSTAYKGFAKLYQGKKYIICQEGFALSEEFAKNKGYHLYQSGGSVTTTALDVAISLQAKKIIFVGLDLAYPNNLVHAEGTSRRKLVEDDNGLITVKDIHGKNIKTNKHLDLYRRWIEKRIEACKEVQFIDATEGGALIKGTTVMPLSDEIE